MCEASSIHEGVRMGAFGRAYTVDRDGDASLGTLDIVYTLEDSAT